MAKRFDLIVFDWDGTLMDSAAAIVACMQAAADDLAVPRPSEAQARQVIGLGLHQALAQAIPELEATRYPELAERYRYHYLSRDSRLTLFSGIEGLLRDLTDTGHWLGVATGKSRLGLRRALADSGIGELFRATRCADECRSKPDPQMLEELMAELMVSAEATLMIGDTSHDLQMARNAGVASVAVAYGAHERPALEACQPLYCADSVEQLADWLGTHA